MSKDDRLEFQVGFDLKTQSVSGKIKLPPLRLPKARLAREIGPVSAMLARMQARRAGRADARDDIPSQRDEPFATAKESAILTMRVRRLGPVAAWLDRVATLVKEYVDKHTPLAIDAVTLNQEIEAKQQNILGAFADDLDEAKKKRTDAEAALATFREEHGLRRPPKYPDLIMRPVAIMLFAFLVDGMLNGVFFSGASASGFVGGIVIAFALSALNIAVGFATGMWGLREIFHKLKQWRRTAGWIITVFGILTGLFLNLFVAHFRDLAERTIAQAQAAAAGSGYRPISLENIEISPVLREVFTSPLGLSHLPSLLLLFSGVIVYLIGLYEGYSGFADRYPEYAGRARELDSARHAQANTGRRTRRLLNRLYARARGRVRIARVAHDYFKDQIQRGMGILVEEHRNGARYQQRLNKHAAQVVRVYQQANTRVRRNPRLRAKHGLTDPPTYFSNDPPLDPIIPDASVREALTHAEEALAIVNANIAELATVDRYIQQQDRSTNARLGVTTK